MIRTPNQKKDFACFCKDCALVIATVGAMTFLPVSLSAQTSPANPAPPASPPAHATNPQGTQKGGTPTQSTPANGQLSPANPSNSGVNRNSTGTTAKNNRSKKTNSYNGRSLNNYPDRSNSSTLNPGGSESASTLKSVQRQLQQAGLYTGSIDGVMGPKTQSALRQYQQQNNLQVTGRLDQNTMDNLGVRPGNISQK